MKTYIYTLSHPETGEIRYVGKTTNLKRRAYQHFNIKICKKLGNKHLGNWLLSILNSNLKPVLEIIEECIYNWVESEQYWIEQFKQWGFNLLNITKGGEGFGHKHSKETIEKLKLSLTGRKLSKEHIDKIKTNFLGKKHSEETKKILSQKHKGKKMSKESIEKMKKTRTGKPAYWNNIKVSLYDKEYNFIQTFESIKSCAEYLNCSHSLIKRAVKNQIKIVLKKYKIKKYE